jgi:poly-gamma-glutamate synthase PgsB/CapB
MELLGTSDDVVFLGSFGVALLALALGAIERRRYRRRLDAIPLRISVNGSRGKSTVTRLLTGALAAGGYRPLGKTTGTEARLVLGWSGEEVALRRRPEGPNIGEQRDMTKRAVAAGADAIVAECMAVSPDYQRTFLRDLVDVNLLVVTNALDDHLEEMGPTSEDVADVFCDTVPAGGRLVVPPGPHLVRFAAAADRRGARLLVADDPQDVDDRLLRRFDHLVMDEHVALTLAVTRDLGIDDEVAVVGMLAAPPDPFATRLLPIGDADDPALLVNAFAANDPVSTLRVWHHVVELGHPTAGLVVVMNCRDDRIPRTKLFAAQVLPNLPIHTLVVVGAATRPITAAVDDGRIVVDRMLDLTGADTATIVVALEPFLAGRVVLGVGNLHGGAAELLAALEEHLVVPVPLEEVN